MMAYKDEWKVYYGWLEWLRQDGRTNMFGATPYLAQAFPDLADPQAVVVSWMENYSALVEDGVCVQ